MEKKEEMMTEQESGKAYKEQYREYLKYMQDNGLGKPTLNSLFHRQFDKIPVNKREQILLIVLSILLTALVIQSYVLINMVM